MEMRIVIRITRCNTLSPLTLFTPRPMMRRTGYVRLSPEAASRMHTAASLAHRSEAAPQVYTLTSLSQRSHSMASERILAPVVASQVHTIASISQESRRQVSPSNHFNPSREAPPRPATLPPQSSVSSELAPPLALAWKLRLRRIAAFEIRLRPLRCKLWD